MSNPLEALIHPDERTAVFIDGANIYAAARAIGVEVDYRRLLEAFRAEGRLIRASYFTALLEHDEFSPIRPLIDWLDYNGYAVVTKPAREQIDAQGRRRIKGDMDIEIAVAMMEAARFADHLFLFSGDGDFQAALAAVQRQGVRVTGVSTLRSQPPMIADELRRQADNFLELADLAQIAGRAQRLGPPRAAGELE